MERNVKKQGYRIAIVEVDGSWKPTDWNDAPGSAVVEEVVKTCSTLDEAQGWIFGYNCQALEFGGSWAVVLDRGELVTPGDVCQRRYTVFTAAAGHSAERHGP